jgi:hypothetical protein
MPFLSKARNFLTSPGTLSTHQYYQVMRDTVEYLLNKAVGMSNAISTDRIIDHLRSKGHKIYREEWQINVLGPLRDNGVFIASKPAVGMFIIKTINDAREVVASMEHRIDVETRRLQILRQIASQGGWNI